MIETPEWIKNEIVSIEERGKDLPTGVTLLLAEFLKEKLSADSIPKAELAKMADKLIAATEDGFSGGTP